MTKDTAQPSSSVSLILASFILFFIAIVFAGGSLSLLIGLPISAFHFPLEMALASLLTFLLFKNQQTPDRFISIALGIALLVLSTLVFSNVIDYSYDSVAYHKTAIGHLAHGWIPSSTTVSQFSEISPLDLAPTSQAVWLEHYAQGPWIFSASIYALTHSIESSKTLTILLVVSLFLYLATKLRATGISKFNAVALSIFVTLSPAALSQIFTFYVDGVLALALFYVCLSLLFFLGDKTRSYQDLWIYCAAVTVCCNAKFTGVPFALLFSFLILLGFLLANYSQNKTFFDTKVCLKNIIYGVGIFTFSIALIGGPVFIKNTLEHGSPFYPLMGKHKADIISPFQPRSFSHTNPYKKFALSFFSHTGNETYKNFRLKIPGTFDFTLAELAPGCGSRAGFGFLFSLIALVSLTGLALLWKKMNQLERVLVALFGVGCVILTGIMDGSWMARYIPYLYAIPLIALYISITNKQVILSRVLMVLLAINLCTFAIHPLYSLIAGHQLMREVASLKREAPLEISLNDQYFTSIVYTLHDAGIKYRWGNPPSGAYYVERLSLNAYSTQQ